MHDHMALVFALTLIFSYGLFSKLSDRSMVTGPMVFLATGLLVSPLGLGLFELHPNSELLKLAAELTLVIILFVDASILDIKALKSARPRIAQRLLIVGLPLTMFLGAITAYVLFPELNIWMILLIAFILSPTDAALGQAVIKNERVPITIRQAISTESGLNDGIALPPILYCIAALSVTTSTHEGDWLTFMFLQLSLGPVVGAIVGYVGGRLVDYAAERDWMHETFQRLSCISLAVISFAGAESVEGNGFIAAFFAGLFLGAKNHAVRERIQDFGEAEGMQLSLLIFLLLGMIMVPRVLPFLTWIDLLYAVLSLTFVRMVPVAISMIGAGLHRNTILFTGWFGPRGIASVLYVMIVVTSLGFAGYERMLGVITLTIVLSIFAHGMSAVPLTNIYARLMEKN
jgi:NhaP-type Na+/H+ or K+/H+ antiporter